MTLFLTKSSIHPRPNTSPVLRTSRPAIASTLERSNRSLAYSSAPSIPAGLPSAPRRSTRLSDRSNFALAVATASKPALSPESSSPSSALFCNTSMRPSRSLLKAAGGLRRKTACQRRRSASEGSERMRAISAAIAASSVTGSRMATRAAERQARARMLAFCQWRSDRRARHCLSPI